MKKLKNGREILIIVIVLTSIAVVSGLLLGVMNKFTQVDQTEALKTKIGELYDSPITQIDIADYQNIADTEILNAFIAEDGAYIVQSKSSKAYSSKGLTLIVIIKDGKVKKIDGKGNSETPGLGSKALADSYLNQYIGVDYSYFLDDQQTQDNQNKGITLEWGLDIPEYNSDQALQAPSGEIQAISGATKSSVGVKYSVKAALAFFENMEGDNE